MTDLPQDFDWTNDELWRMGCAGIAQTIDALSNGTTPNWFAALVTAMMVAGPDNQEAIAQIHSQILGFTEGGSPEEDYLDPERGEIPIAALYAYLSRTFSALADGASPDDVLMRFAQPAKKDTRDEGLHTMIRMYAHALADDDGRQKVYQAQKRLAKITGIDFKKIQTIWKRQQRKTKGQSLSPSDVMMAKLRGIVVG